MLNLMVLKSPIAYSFCVLLQWGAKSTNGCVLRNTTEWLYLNLNYDECELAPLI